MNRRHFLGSLAATAVAQPRRPNIIMLVTDDQGIGDVGCFGVPEARTPNLDRLAATGVRFTQWYSNAPICSASRAAIMTGKYPDRAGVEGALPSRPAWDVPGLRAGEVTLATSLKKLGYRTAALGKWHLGSAPASRPMSQGFDEFFGYYSGWLDAYSHRYYQLGANPGMIFHDLWRNDQEVFEDPMYFTELLGRESQAFLTRQRRTQPFFMYLAFGAPHYTLVAPKKYLDRFPASMHRDRRTHLAMVAAVDDVVGAILAQLSRAGIANDTIVYYQSDNGATREVRAAFDAKPATGGSNGKYRGFKQGLFDGGMHVPAILRAPGFLPAGRVEDRPMMSMDLHPTLLAMAGGEPPDSVDGHNILPVIKGEKQTHEYMFWSFGTGRAVRNRDWKLLVNPPQFPGEPVSERLWLSNLEADPTEQKNLAATERPRVQQMILRLREWEKYVGIQPAQYE